MHDCSFVFQIAMKFLPTSLNGVIQIQNHYLISKPLLQKITQSLLVQQGLLYYESTKVLMPRFSHKTKTYTKYPQTQLSTIPQTVNNPPFYKHGKRSRRMY